MDEDLKNQVWGLYGCQPYECYRFGCYYETGGCNIRCVSVRSLYTKNVVVLPKSPEKGEEYYGMSPPKRRVWSSLWQS